MRSTYRRCLRASQYCVPEFREGMAEHIRERFRAYPLRGESPQARLDDAESQLQRMIEMLLSQGRMNDTMAKKLSQNQPSAECHAATDSEESGCSADHSTTPAAQWDSGMVGSWLIHLGLERHAPAFREHNIDGRLLLRLDDVDLSEELGVTSRIERKRILLECEALRDNER